MTAEPKTSSESQHLYSIRIATKLSTTCAICDQATGAGPVGYQNDDPVCDRCLLDACGDLGLVLALVSVTRAFGAIPLKHADAGREGVEQLAAFARVFEHVMAKKAKRRGLELPGGVGSSGAE